MKRLKNCSKVSNLCYATGSGQLSGGQVLSVATSEFQSKLNQQIQDIPRNVTKALEVYNRLSRSLNRYHGGMPVGFLAAIASFESGGKMSSVGDASLGEIGIFQITSSFPPKVGLPAESRKNEETNIFLGCLEYQIMAVEMWLANTTIRLGSDDNWKLARLAFAVGPGGTRKLLASSGANSYSQLVDYIDRTGGISLGGQSAGKVWFRVRVIDVLWEVGRRVQPMSTSGAPVKLPNPPIGKYSLPSNVAAYIHSPLRGPLIALTLASALLFLA
jgi:hypothetical protein